MTKEGMVSNQIVELPFIRRNARRLRHALNRLLVQYHYNSDGAAIGTASDVLKSTAYLEDRLEAKEEQIKSAFAKWQAKVETRLLKLEGQPAYVIGADPGAGPGLTYKFWRRLPYGTGCYAYTDERKEQRRKKIRRRNDRLYHVSPQIRPIWINGLQVDRRKESDRRKPSP
jgi:hypothetical protein